VHERLRGPGRVQPMHIPKIAHADVGIRPAVPASLHANQTVVHLHRLLQIVFFAGRNHCGIWPVDSRPPSDAIQWMGDDELVVDGMAKTRRHGAGAAGTPPSTGGATSTEILHEMRGLLLTAVQPGGIPCSRDGFLPGGRSLLVGSTAAAGRTVHSLRRCRIQSARGVDSHIQMRIRLTRKFSQSLNGVDLSRLRVGDVTDLPQRDADLLLAEGWARAADESEIAAEEEEFQSRNTRRPTHKSRP
jgi:hypothetical protein